jgi:hypothetical protein
MMTVHDALAAWQYGSITTSNAMRLTAATDVMELHAFAHQSGLPARTRLLPRGGTGDRGNRVDSGAVGTADRKASPCSFHRMTAKPCLPDVLSTRAFLRTLRNFGRIEAADAIIADDAAAGRRLARYLTDRPGRPAPGAKTSWADVLTASAGHQDGSKAP